MYSRRLLLALVPLIVLCSLMLFNEGLELDLPAEHVKYYFRRRPDVAAACLQDPNCPYRDSVGETSDCWGYEPGCQLNESFGWKRIECSTEESLWARTMYEKRKLFWEQADFGYIMNRGKTMKTICQAEQKGDSSLKCTKFLEYCFAKNIFFDFKSLNLRSSSDRYRSDVIHEGEVGGKCQLFPKRLHAYTNRTGFLQGWYSELKYFETMEGFQLDNAHCDVIFETPVILIKLDAGISMYHHYCDFINLYASQHLNGSFDRNVDIVIWDTHMHGYNDLFAETWKAFTNRPLIGMKKLDGRKVCFREVMMPMLARMFFGLYFNMPLIPKCRNSGLAHAFSKHLLHRLRITQHGPLLSKIRVTYLQRKTKFRRILNSDEIIRRLEAVPDFKVNVVQFEYKVTPFLDQVRIAHNSDIFIGVHGSGLTHMFYLPDWAALFEAYHCNDRDCYKDLAQIRGVKFFSWVKDDLVKLENQTAENIKFTNFWLDADEFMRITMKAADYVRRNPEFRRARREVMENADEEL